MKKRVKQLINGEFEYVVPKIILSSGEIKVQVRHGESHQGEFFFGAEDESKIQGIIFSTNRRIILGRRQFAGNTIHTQYGLDTTGLAGKETVAGEIVISSNLGEYRIKVRFKVYTPEVQTAQGELTNLDQFTKLAKTDYQEAFRLFSKKAFLELLKGGEEQYKSLYKGMSHNPITYQHMEEFFIGAGKKEPVMITIDKSSKEMLRLESSTKDSIFIYKNTWGYTRLEIRVEGDFLEIDKKIVTTDDFIGSVYGLEYVILREKLGPGKQCGRIIIHNVYETQVFEIWASASRDYQISTRDFENQIRKNILQDYVSYGARQISVVEWQKRIFDQLDELKNAGCFTTFHQLLEVYAHYQGGNVQKAIEGLYVFKNRSFTKEEANERGLFLFLVQETGLLTGEEEDINEEMDSLYRMNQGSILLLLLLLRMDHSLGQSPVKQLYILERQFEIGCTSPLLYLEAAKILQKDESHLKKLSPFMIQTLVFASRYGLLNQELGMRISYMAAHEKKFRQSIYRILAACYEIYPGKDIIEAICKLVMMGNPGKKEYFQWYEKAVEQDVRITRLYEYYIETMSRNHREQLPKPVLLYFAYHNTLSSSKKAFVYGHVIRGKDSDSQTYENYKEAMAAFAMESLMAGRMNEDYAVLYQEFLEQIDNTALGEAAARVIFTYRLYCDDKKVRNVIVCHQGLREEAVYPCSDKVAFIQLYTLDAQIIFEDAKHRRYAKTVDYNLQKLMDEKAIVRQCTGMDVDYPGLLLSVCGSDIARQSVDIHNLGCFRHIANSDAFEPEYAQEACRKLLAYYDVHAGNDTLDEYLRELDYDAFYQVDGCLLIDVLIRRGFCQQAYELINEYGYEKIEPGNLLRICRRMILDQEFEEDEGLFQLAYYVLSKGKYDEVILGYLRDSYLGPIDTMITVWENLKGFQMDDTYAYEEQILIRAMYTRVYPYKLAKVLESYITNRGAEEIVAAVLTFLSYGYFLGDIRTDAFIFRALERVVVPREDLDMICSLALLKRYSQSKKITNRQKELITSILSRCNKKELRFAFFNQLPPECTKSLRLEDRIFVETMVHPRAKVTLHFAIDQGEYTTEPLKKHYHGIFTREFLLFYGERLTWYLTIQLDQEVQKTEPQTVVMDTVSETGQSRYQMINIMLANRELGRDQLLDQTMEQYLNWEQMTDHLFTLIE